MSTASADQRSPSLLDASCEAFVQDLAALSPSAATAWGIPGYEDKLENFSPAYWDAVADRTREMIADIDAFDDCTDDSDDDDDFDDVDHVTAETLRDRLCLELDLHHRLEYYRQLNNIESPVQTISQVFLLMPQDTEEQRELIRARLTQVGPALAGYQESLSEAAAHGKVAAHRQIDEVINQCENLADSGSLLEHLGLPADCPEVEAAQRAFGEMADWLSEHLGPHAPHEDAVGRDRYELFSRYFVGDAVDLDEAYEWGLEQLHDIAAEQRQIVDGLYGPDCSIRQAFRALNNDERYQLHGTGELVEWMQRTADGAIADLADTHFSIPENLRRIECRIDPAGTGGIYYTPPSDDLSRPGRMWWSVPAGQDTFHTWQELTTVYHEGVPGHHLQLGQALSDTAGLNLWRRVVCWIPGHGEGWALYAEKLMDELGYHSDPATRLGYLDAQRLRAARVAVDIGVHLGKKIPEGTTVWDASFARSFLRDNTAMDDANLTFELNRYLGWPGQAPSYALGQRMWDSLREEATARGMSLREFHDTALSYGSIPMSLLRAQILR
ncbi:DUF885 domain-containing protein [Corynebacterium uropygiale]|uniref:DUF885 domain-containing protein n=1 Tax=Corynebacterium uropygiale TaxID=1775911 RepID=A0A9X1QLT3_9CORY|nr:DUF885 domain-containing protein [Corynebacterium uropygiale]MCF4005604.1 DUF885 domain-containing protein [Corynebacterium uropygiale]